MIRIPWLRRWTSLLKFRAFFTVNGERKAPGCLDSNGGTVRIGIWKSWMSRGQDCYGDGLRLVLLHRFHYGKENPIWNRSRIWRTQKSEENPWWKCRSHMRFFTKHVSQKKGSLHPWKLTAGTFKNPPNWKSENHLPSSSFFWGSKYEFSRV